MSALKAALVTKLSADSTLTAMLGTAADGHTYAIYDSQAPDAADFPYLIIQKFDGESRYTLGARSHKQEMYMVKAIDECPTDSVNAKPAEDIDDRVDVTLGFDPTLSISGKTQIYTRRKRDLPDYQETKARSVYVHRGGLYEIWSA